MRNNPFMKRQRTATPLAEAVRNPIQGDLSAVLDKTRAEDEDPRVKRPAIMIRSVRYVGATKRATPAEAMTAKSHALYQYLMASAQLELKTDMTATEYQVPFADAQAFLNVPRADRIREYVEAINKTFVSYEFEEANGKLRRGVGVQLLACEENVLPSGESVIEYSMHPSVRKVILEPRQYANLEIAAFARFTSKYSPRLYEKLALVAGMPEQHPITFTPEQLAEELGYAPRKNGKFHWGHFEGDCLKPCMADMFGSGGTEIGKEFKAPSVRRFFADYEVVRAPSRGRPVTAVVFNVTKAEKHLREEQTSEIVLLDRNKVRKMFVEAGLDRASETPNEELLARAAARLNTTITNIAQRWADVMAIAKDDPEALVGSLGYYTGRQILDMIAADGVGKAFADWLLDWRAPAEIRYRQTSCAAPEKPRVSFAEAKTIRIEFNENVCTKCWIRTEVLEWADNLNLFSSGDEKTVHIEWTANGHIDHIEFDAPFTSQALRMIHTEHRDHVKTMEFLR